MRPFSGVSSDVTWFMQRSVKAVTGLGTFSRSVMPPEVIFAMTATSMISSAWDVIRRCAEVLALALLCLAGLDDAARAATAPEPAACRTVRLADAGWTDVTVTTALLSELLRRLGYEPHTTLLSVPVTFAVMKAGNIDIFLGNWMPAQTRDRQPYIDDGSIVVVRENLAGAKYTLAVPAYTY